MNRDLAFGAAGLALAAAYYAAAAAIPETLLADGVGPAGLPKTYGVVLAALSSVLVVRSLGAAARSRSAAGVSPPVHVPPALRRAAGMLLVGLLYLAIVSRVGYAVSIALLIGATAWYQGGVFNRRIAVVAVSGAILFWLLFVLLLRIPHPSGVWPALFRPA